MKRRRGREVDKLRNMTILSGIYEHFLEDVRWQMLDCTGWCAAPGRTWGRTRLSPSRLQPQLFCPQLPSQERPSPSFAPGKGRKLHGASQFPPHLASSCRFFCPHQFGKNAKSWSRCTQPPWSVNWIYGYQPYFSPFSASQIQEYHATCERKHREGEMKTR